MSQFHYLSHLLRCADKAIVHQAIRARMDNVPYSTPEDRLNRPKSDVYLEAWAEDVILLTSDQGRVALDAGRMKMEDPDKKAFDLAGNQYSRALWLYIHQTELFDNAVRTCQSLDHCEEFQHSLFFTECGLNAKPTTASLKEFRRSLAPVLGCEIDDIAVDAFHKKLRENESPVFYVEMYYNQPQELFGLVINGVSERYPIDRAAKVVISYQPDIGILCVFSDNFAIRKDISYLFVRCFLNSQCLERANYAYQHLATPTSLLVDGFPVQRARVTELGCTSRGSELLYKINPRDLKDIYTPPQNKKGHFSFENHVLTKAKISIRLDAFEQHPVRDAYIVLKNKCSCSLKAEYLFDRLLCNTLLSRWGIIRRDGVA